MSESASLVFSIRSPVGAFFRFGSDRGNGPEPAALAVADWAEENGVELEFIKPGKPMQNGFIKRFNGNYREAVLHMHIFESLKEVRIETEKWLGVYNQQRPHEGLGNLSPMEYLQKFSLKIVI